MTNEKTAAELDAEIAQALREGESQVGRGSKPGRESAKARPKPNVGGVRITDAQARQLEIIRAAGGTIVRRHFEWFVPGSSKPIRGLNGNALDNLVKAGLLRSFHSDGTPSSRYGSHRLEIAS